MLTVDGKAVDSDLDGDEATKHLLLDAVAALQLLVVTAFLGCLLAGSLIALLKNGVGDNGNREGDDSEDVLGKHVYCLRFEDWKSMERLEW